LIRHLPYFAEKVPGIVLILPAMQPDEDVKKVGEQVAVCDS